MIANSGFFLSYGFRLLSSAWQHDFTEARKPLLPNGYYPAFVASLVWNDHSLQTYVDGQSQLTEQQILNVSYIIAFSEFQLKVIRGPEMVDRF